MVIEHLCEYTKSHWIEFFKCVNCLVGKIYLSKTVKISWGIHEAHLGFPSFWDHCLCCLVSNILKTGASDYLSFCCCCFMQEGKYTCYYYPILARSNNLPIFQMGKLSSKATNWFSGSVISNLKLRQDFFLSVQLLRQFDGRRLINQA